MLFYTNSNPISKCTVEGRHFLIIPYYFIRQVNQKQSIQNQELKFEEPEQKKEVNIENKENKNDIIELNTYVFPGLSKNYYKNLGNKLSSFIKNNFRNTEIIQDPKIQKFIKIQKQKYTKTHFRRLLKSKVAKQILKMYFGNYLWCSSILKQQKSDIEFYLDLNKQIFRRKQKQQIQTELNKLPEDN